MAAARCLHNSRTALYRVFVSPPESSQASQLLGRSLALGQPWHHQPPSTSARQPPFSRAFSTTPSTPAIARNRNRQKGAAPDRLPIDHEIRDRQIMLIGEQNSLTGPFNTQKVLRETDLGVYSVRMVKAAGGPPQKDQKGPQAAAGGGGGGGSDSRYPICRVVNKADEYKREQQRAKAKKDSERAARVKELEINWAIAENDLALKLRQLRGFLEKGQKVDVLMATKRKARRATREEVETVARAVEEVVAEVPGVKERKPREGEPGGKMVLFFEPVLQKA